MEEGYKFILVLVFIFILFYFIKQKYPEYFIVIESKIGQTEGFYDNYTVKKCSTC